MRFALVASLLALGTWLTPAIAAADTISYADFSSVASLNLVGNAAQAGSALRVTEAAPDHAGSAWHDTKHDVAGGFETTFEFQITNPGQLNVGEAGGDGFAFVIQNASATAFTSKGDTGFYMGYEIENSLAVEFDTFDNFFWTTAPALEPNNNHVGVQSRGTAENTASFSAATADAYLGSATVAPNLSDGAVHTGKVVYAPGTLSVFVDDLDNAVLTVSVDLDALLALDGGSAYVGFTAGGDTAYENHDILSWSFASTIPEPTTFALLSLGLVGLGIGARRRV